MSIQGTATVATYQRQAATDVIVMITDGLGDDADRQFASILNARGEVTGSPIEVDERVAGRLVNVHECDMSVDDFGYPVVELTVEDKAVASQKARFENRGPSVQLAG